MVRGGWGTYPRAVAHLWAYREFEWVPGNHWTRVVRIDGLRDLAATLRASHVKHGTIARLGIVAHGDSDGVVQLDPVLQPSSISALRPDIVEVGRFLTPGAFIEFYACVAGAGAAGRQLLTRLSGVLPGAHLRRVRSQWRCQWLAQHSGYGERHAQ